MSYTGNSFLVSSSLCGKMLLKRGDDLKLNLDCIRDILLVIEEDQVMRKIDKSFLCDEEGVILTGSLAPIYSDYLLRHKDLKIYTPDDILYSIKQMIECGLLENESIQGCTGFCITDITPFGHEFISNLRSPNVWDKVKSGVKTISGASIPVISKVAAETVLKMLLS